MRAADTAPKHGIYKDFVMIVNIATGTHARTHARTDSCVQYACAAGGGAGGFRRRAPSGQGAAAANSRAGAARRQGEEPGAPTVRPG